MWLCGACGDPRPDEEPTHQDCWIAAHKGEILPMEPSVNLMIGQEPDDFKVPDRIRRISTSGAADWN